MENNLYYTPTIEEFHVGFEYEHLTGFEKEFKFYIYDLAKACLIIERESISHNGEIVKMFIPAIQACIEEKQCRVKYLDQSDIESLGWIVKGEDHFIKGDWILLKYDDGLIIYLDYYAGKLQHSWMYEDSVKTLFEGTIKNKSELIKLMQQLNIK